MDNKENKQVRNFVARDLLTNRKSKKFADRRERRAKDSRKSWKSEEH